MDRKELFSYFEERFGIDRKEFENLEFYEKSKGRIYSVNKPAFKLLESVNRPISAGLLFARMSAAFKPTSVIIQIFGRYAKKNILDLDVEEAKTYISGLDLEMQNTGNCTDGYVIVRYNDYSLGIGLLKAGKLKNMLQKGKRTNVKFL